MTLRTPFFLLFLGGSFTVLRRVEDGHSPLAITAVTSGAIVAVLWPVSAVLNHIGLDIDQAGGDPAAILGLDGIGAYILALSTLPRVVLLVATAVTAIHSQLIPHWIGWAGLGQGVAEEGVAKSSVERCALPEAVGFLPAAGTEDSEEQVGDVLGVNGRDWIIPDQVKGSGTGQSES